MYEKVLMISLLDYGCLKPRTRFFVTVSTQIWPGFRCHSSGWYWPGVMCSVADWVLLTVLY